MAYEHLKKLLAKNGMKQADLAQLINRSAAVVTNLFQGVRSLQVEEVERIASYFQVTTNFVLYGEVPREYISIKGTIRGDDIVELLDADQVERVDLPPDVATGVFSCAYRYSSKNWLCLVGARIMGNCDDFSDTPYIVKIKNGETVLCYIRRGHQVNHYNLLQDKTLIENVQIEWCEPVERIITRL